MDEFIYIEPSIHIFINSVSIDLKNKIIQNKTKKVQEYKVLEGTRVHTMKMLTCLKVEHNHN